MKVEGGRPGLPSLKKPTVSVDVMQHNEMGSELRSRVKVEVATLGSPSLTALMVSTAVRQH